MYNILITKDVAYGAGGTTPVNMANLTTLAHGGLAIIGDNNKVLLPDGSNAAGVNTIQFVVGITKDSSYGIGTQASVAIPVANIKYINMEVYNAPQVQIVDIGPFPSAVGSAKGELGFKFNNNSYLRTIQTDQIRISEYKKSSTTLSSVLQKIVNRINNGTGLPSMGVYKTFMSAALVGSADADYKIRLTMKSEHVDFSSACYGLAEDALQVTVQKAVLSKGAGADVKRTEDEYSGNLGNAGYGWRNELYFAKQLEADANGTYDILSIHFEGLHDTPQNKVRAAMNWLQVAIPTGSNLSAKVVAILTAAVPNYNPTKDQQNESDGNPTGNNANNIVGTP